MLQVLHASSPSRVASTASQRQWIIEQVHFLDPRGALVRVRTGGHRRRASSCADPAAVLARSARRRASRARARPRSRRPRCRELPEVEIASSTSPRGAQRAHLLGEHLLERVVVGDRGQDRGVGGERDRRQLGPLALEAADHLGGEVLRVGGGSAVAAGEDLAVGEQASRSSPPRRGQSPARASPRRRS